MVPLNKMATMSIYGKTLKSLFLQNQESFEGESWYIASRLKVYQICSNDIHRLTFDLFNARTNLDLLKHLYGENVEKSFSQNVLKTNGLNLQYMFEVVNF